ncbi:uncharacterized protein ACBR49_000524 [Aulostomus maculatus]
MKLALLCLCLASSASAAPSFFHYLPHFAGSRQQIPPTQVKNTYTTGPSVPQTGAYSMELIYPHQIAGGAGGVNPAQPFPSHGFIKYSIPQPPGRQSVEVYYPYDFSQQRVLPFEFPSQNIPQQIPNVRAFDANPLPSQDPLQPAQQDQPPQTNQMPVNV